MTTRRKLAIGITGIVLIGVAYASTYLMLRTRHLDYRPFYVAIMYGEDRFVVRCVNQNFLKDDAVGVITGHLSTDSLWNPEAGYEIETNGLFVVMNKKDTLAWRRLFWPLELMELKHMRFRDDKEANKRLEDTARKLADPQH